MSILSSKQMKMIYDHSHQYMLDSSTYNHINSMIINIKNRPDVDAGITVEEREIEIPSNSFPLVLELLEECRKNVSKRMDEHVEKILDVLGIGERGGRGVDEIEIGGLGGTYGGGGGGHHEVVYSYKNRMGESKCDS